MERALQGRIATAFTLSPDPGPLVRRVPRKYRRWADAVPWLFLCRPTCMVKLVNSTLALDWIEARFPATRQVYVVRHPCGQFSSWRSRGWEPEPRRLLEDRRLVDEHLAPFVSLIEQADDFWERAGALWGAMNKVVWASLSESRVRTVVTFEWLCQDVVAHYRELYELVGLPWTPAAEAFLTRMDSADDRPYSLKRQSAQQPAKWLAALAPEEIERCRRFAEPFGLPWYPDFAPEPLVPVGPGQESGGCRKNGSPCCG